MKKTMIYFIIILLHQNISAQFWKEKISGNGNVVEKTRSIDFFDKISVTGAFEVKIYNGKSGKITIRSDENLIDIIETYTKSGKLIIRINPDFDLRKYKVLYLEVPVEYLTQINLTGSGHIFNDFDFDGKNLQVNLTGSGEIFLSSRVNHTKLNLTGSGQIKIDGKTELLEAKLTGSGDIEAKNLTAQECEAKLTGSGNMDITVVKKLEAKLSGSGIIYYYGEPDFLKTKSFGSGDIIYRKL
jgi:hypothetical protein